jgi:hypothetical protein
LSSSVIDRSDKYLTMSDQPFSKFQAIFALEQIKERNKPQLAKEDLPQMPFFLFDLDKATNLDAGENGARDFLKETFFTSFEQKRQSKVKQVGGAAMHKNDQKTQLIDLLKTRQDSVLQYLKSLSPSGVELEIMTLDNFDLQDQDSKVSPHLNPV